MSQDVKRESGKLTSTQWKAVGAVGLAASVAGPIVMAAATIGAAGGCYASNKLGWSEPESD